MPTNRQWCGCHTGPGYRWTKSELHKHAKEHVKTGISNVINSILMMEVLIGLNREEDIAIPLGDIRAKAMDILIEYEDKVLPIIEEKFAMHPIEEALGL